jgi:trimethylamine--corrinoid protein Co-methyltransferase
VDEDALAVDIVAAAMSGSRSFLEQKHTRRYLRAGELLYLPLAERRSWDAWEQDGRAGMAGRAQAEAERILAQHEVAPLSTEQERQLDAIMQEAQRELVRD